jgi:hypothetical protein
MRQIETDYLVIGAGAAGLAFADTLVDQTDARITIVDRHGKPGGHWNDAYAFVTLHQPSSFYGVASMPLGSGRKDTLGLNQGLMELASGPEICGYFERVMNHRLLQSGRVSYHPMSNYLGDAGDHRFVSILSGAQTQVTVRRKLVDARLQSPSVPATHRPRFDVGADVALLPPGALPGLWHARSQRAQAPDFVIVGAGKTAMDAAIWLLNAGAPAASIRWVVPRDSWLLNRHQTQPDAEFFAATIGGQASQMEAFASATSVDDLFARLEAAEVLMRIDRQHKPSMFHLATISRGELELLRTIGNVIRMGHVRAIERERLVLDGGSVPIGPDTICIDCTASAVEKRPNEPVFQAGRIVLQMLRLPQPCFSAALVAYVEARYGSDADKNRLCAPVPFPHTLDAYVGSMMVSMWNQFQWGQDKALRQWIRDCRLDGYGQLMASADRDDAAQQAILARFKAGAMAAMANMQKLVAAV